MRPVPFHGARRWAMALAPLSLVAVPITVAPAWARVSAIAAPMPRDARGNQIGHCVQRGEEAGAGGIDVQRGYGCAEGDLFVYQRGGAGNGLHADGDGADDAVQLGGGNARFV